MLEGVQPLVHLRYTSPSYLPDPGRLAVPIRPGVVRAALRPHLRSQAQAALSFTGLLRQTGSGVLSPPPGCMAPRGAPGGQQTLPTCHGHLVTESAGSGDTTALPVLSSTGISGTEGFARRADSGSEVGGVVVGPFGIGAGWRACDVGEGAVNVGGVDAGVVRFVEAVLRLRPRDGGSRPGPPSQR